MPAQTELVLQTVVKWTETATKALNDVKGSLDWINKSATSMWSTFKDTFAALGAYDLTKNVWQWLIDIWKSAIDLASWLEQTKVAFTTMTWSARIADAFIREMTNFAKTTPFEIWDLEVQSKRLLAYWFEIQEILPTLTTLGNIASWVWMEKLPNLTYALWQVRAATKLTWNELRQFSEAWVPLLEELSKTMWKSIPEIQKMVSEWKVGFPQVEAALKSLTWEWWRFFNLMENQSKTFWGMVSNFKDTLTIMLRDMWTEFLPDLKAILASMLQFWDENWKSMSLSFTWFIKTVAWTFWTALKWMAIAIDFFGNFFTSSSKNSTDNVAFSWKNLFLYLDTWLKALIMFFKVVWNRIAYEMVKAFEFIKLWFENFKDFAKSTWAWIVWIWKYIWTNLQHWVETWVQGAMSAMDSLINLINKIPWMALDTYWSTFKATASITLDEAMKLWEWVLWINENFWQKAIELAKQKTDALSAIDEEWKTIIISWMTDIESTFVKFKNSQNETAKWWETLAKVLSEIGWALWNVWQKWQEATSWASKWADKLKKSIEDIKLDSSKLSKELTDNINKQKESLDKLNESYWEMKIKLTRIWAEWVVEVDNLKNAMQELRRKWDETMKSLVAGLTELETKWNDSVQKLRDKISELNTEMSKVQSTGISDIAKRAIEAQKEYAKLIGIAKESDVLAKAQSMSSAELSSASAKWQSFIIWWKTFTAEDLQKIVSLTKELAIAKWSVSQADLLIAQKELDKTEIEKIMDKITLDKQAIQIKLDATNAELLKQQEINSLERQAYAEKINNARISHNIEMQQAQAKINKKIADNIIEIEDYKKLMDKKTEEIKKEEVVYTDLIAQKKKLDADYFNKFWQQLQSALNKTAELTTRIAALTWQWINTSGLLTWISWARATGWPVTWGSSYLVWEKWTEIFTPWTSGQIIPNNKINGGGNIVINFTWTFWQNAAEEIWDMVVRQLSRASFI